MATIKISDTKKREIIDHVYNTSHELIKCYDIKQLALIEWKNVQSIKKDPRFLPVRIDTSMARTKQKMWANRNCYTTKRIRLDEIKHIYNKRTWRKLVVEFY